MRVSARRVSTITSQAVIVGDKTGIRRPPRVTGKNILCVKDVRNTADDVGNVDIDKISGAGVERRNKRI